MIYKLSADNFELSQSASGYIDRLARKIDRYLPSFSHDLPVLQVFIRSHTTRRYFDGSVVLFLSRRTLVARFKAPTIEQAVKVGFWRIRKELRDFKGKHFEHYG